MSLYLVPAAVAASGGSAMLAGIWWHERRIEEAMRTSRVKLALRFPIGLKVEAALAALDGLSGLPTEMEIVAEVSATSRGVEHSLWVPRSVRSSVLSTLSATMPSLRVSETQPSPGSGVTMALRLFVPTPSLLSTVNTEVASRALLAGMANLGDDERMVVRYALRPGTPSLWREPDSPTVRQREIAREWRHKTAKPGLRVSGLVLIRTATVVRARELAAHVESVLASRRGLTGSIRATREQGNRTLASVPHSRRSSGWLTATELLPLLAWPLGPGVTPGVSLGAARQLPVPREISRKGRVLFVGRDFNGERPVAQSTEAAKHHLCVVGPTGVGKSSLLANCVLSDIARGDSGGVVIDPKADLIQTILDRIEAKDANRVVVLDPSDNRPMPGLAVLAGGDPDLAADVLTGALKSIFADVWGVRSDFYLRLAVRSLAEVSGSTLADVGRLFFDEQFRRMVVGRLSDRFVVSAWQSYEALSEAAKSEHVQAPMNRVMGLLTRPRVRAVLACPNPTLDLGQILRQRKWLLVSLAPGQIGEAAATLIGAIVMYATWAAIEARVALPPQQRTPVFIYADELSTLTGGVPFSFELLAERARGLGAGLTVAAQTLGRVPEPTRQALLGNVGSFVSFRASAEEAPRIARQLPGLTDSDLMGLDRFEVAGRIGTGVGSSVSVVTGRTLPLPATTGLAETIRAYSAARYGVVQASDPVAPTPEIPESGTKPGRTGRAI